MKWKNTSTKWLFPLPKNFGKYKDSAKDSGIIDILDLDFIRFYGGFQVEIITNLIKMNLLHIGPVMEVLSLL